jgi:hypothetical protein
MDQDPQSWWGCTHSVLRTTGTTWVGLDHLTFSPYCYECYTSV